MRSLNVDATWKGDVIGSELPVIVKFTGPGCPPCMMLQPILEELAAEFAGRVNFVLSDIQHAPEMFDTHGVVGVPTLMVFKGGQPVAQRVGAAPKPTIRTWIEERL